MFNVKVHKNPSVMKHTFSRVPQAEIQRSSFDRSHGHKTTFDAGLLIPVLVDEVVPGDTFKVDMTAFARMATPIFPIMDNMYMDSHFFFVPLRLIWNNFQKFMGEQDNPDDSTDFTVPQVVIPGTVGAADYGTLRDYMGIFPYSAEPFSVSALFFRAYNLCWNSWFRDQNMQDSVVVDKDDGPDTLSDYVVLRRGKRHDYFTSCLPWPQKGDAVSLPLGTTADVVSDAGNITVRGAVGTMTTLIPISAVGGDVETAVATTAAALNFGADGTNTTGLRVDLTAATGATINTLRQSFQLQRLLERDARGGTRYTEIVRAHFRVHSPDARLQRPEYLGGGSTPINVSAIPQTSSTDGTSPQGNLAAIGVGLAAGHGFTASFTEHGIIIGLVSVRADLTYGQGTNRMFHRSTKYDYYWPALAHIGEQAVLRKEIYNTGFGTDDEIVFGYQERFAEMRYKPSLITGLMRVDATGTLSAWHLSQDFATPPTLDATFIVENPPVDRVIAVPSQPHFIFDSYFRMHCARPMPTFGVPGLIDHF